MKLHAATKRKKKKPSALALFRRIVKDFKPYSYEATVVLAAVITKTPVTIYYDSASYCYAIAERLLELSAIDRVNENIVHLVNTNIPNNRMREETTVPTTLGLLLEDKTAIESPDDLLNGTDLFPKTTVQLTEKKLTIMRNKAEDVEITSEVLDKMFSIVKHLVITVASDFIPTKAPLVVPFIKAVAALSGHKTVMIDDLWYMHLLYSSHEMLPAYKAAVESFLHDHSTLVANLTTRLETTKRKHNAALAAINSGLDINYYNADIKDDDTIDMLNIELLNVVTDIKAELMPLLDGAPRTPQTKELLALLKTCETTEASLRSQKGYVDGK